LRTRPQNLAILITVIALAVALTFAASGGALARPMFQSSVLPSPGVTETPAATGTIPVVPTFTPTVVGSITQNPTVPELTPTTTLVTEATPTVPGIINVTPTVFGFLPPPTLVNPNALMTDQPTPVASESGPLAGPAASPEPTATQTPSAVPDAAQLIDSGVLALSYLWLCCGALLLVAVALAVFWLWRRSKRR
jgi:hypothetical protein